MNKEDTQLLLQYYRNPEAQYIYPEASSNTYFHTKQEASCFLWKTNRACPQEIKVTKMTYFSDGQFNEVTIIHKRVYLKK